MGYSIGKVFKPIEEDIRKYAEVDALYLPASNYSPKGLWRNIKAVRTAIKNKKYDVVHITGTENYLIVFLQIIGLVFVLYLSMCSSFVLFYLQMW